VLFDFPKSSSFGRVLPKSKIYEHAAPKASLKELFVRQVEQISWQFKLAPETINLPATPTVPEIQIFFITLKTGELKPDVLHCIDQAIPFPILFELRYGGQIKPMAAYKSIEAGVDSKWRVGHYLEADWLPVDTARSPLPMVLNLESLYARLLGPLMPYPAWPGEGLRDHVQRIERIMALREEIEKCTARLRKESQFNRKVPINATLRSLKQELSVLTSALKGPEGSRMMDQQ
jgi:hypothetical protein